jgi:CheY-like chemotaxis protein
LVQLLRQAGYDAGADETVRTGRELMHRLAASADIDVVLIDQAIPDTELTHLLPQLRADVFSGLIPVIVTVTPDSTGKVPLALEQKLNRLAEQYPAVKVIHTPRDAATLKRLLEEQIQNAHGAGLTEAERKGFVSEAMVWLARMARGEAHGYDIRPAQLEILAALRSDELASLAIEAAGKLPGSAPQRELARIVLDNDRDPRFRIAAAHELTRHLQQNNLVLGRDQLKALVDLYPSLKGDEVKNLRSAVAAVIGGLRLDSRQTGQRLQAYVPPPPAAQEGKLREEKKEGEKPEDGKAKKDEGK